MFVSHIFKTMEYFVIEGFPVVPIEHVPEAIEGFIFNTLKLITIYSSMLG